MLPSLRFKIICNKQQIQKCIDDIGLSLNCSVWHNILIYFKSFVDNACCSSWSVVLPLTFHQLQFKDAANEQNSAVQKVNSYKCVLCAVSITWQHNHVSQNEYLCLPHNKNLKTKLHISCTSSVEEEYFHNFRMHKGLTTCIESVIVIAALQLQHILLTEMNDLSNMF